MNHSMPDLPDSLSAPPVKPAAEAAVSKQPYFHKHEKAHEKADKTNKSSQGHSKKPYSSALPWQPEQFIVPPQPGKTRFHDLGLTPEVLRAIQEMGFEYCSPIQAQILPHTLRGADAIGKAQTGTGKTAAFLITIIEDLLGHAVEGPRYADEPRALILAPTRELVLQIADDARQLARYVNFNTVTLIGGEDYGKQKRQLQGQRLVDIVIATPGRLIDFVLRRDIYINQVETLVLDEADRMLDMGFMPQVKQIMRHVPAVEFRQTQLFSATFNQDILNLAYHWTYEPVYAEIEPEQVATHLVEQIVYLVSQAQKNRVLVNILGQPEVKRTIIFTNRRDQSQHLYERLRRAGFKAGILSGEITQQKRTETLQQFKEHQIDVLVATDVVGRGIHVDGVSHVINYNLPENAEDYVHRIGRTGRAGAHGVAISLACEQESFELPMIEKLLGKKLRYEVVSDELLR